MPNPDCARTVDVDKITPKEIVPGFLGRVFESPSSTFLQWTIESGALLPEHSHVHEQVSYVIEGEFEFTVDGTKTVLTRGMACILPSHCVHSGRAITDCKILDVFHPIREDYR